MGLSLQTIAQSSSAIAARARVDSLNAVRRAYTDSVRTATTRTRDSLKAMHENELEKRRIALEEKNERLRAARRIKIQPLTQEIAFGFRLNSDGWSFLVQRGFMKIEDPEKSHTNFLWFDIS